MEFYRHNARRVPQVSGEIVPIPATSRAAYESQVLQPIYDALEPFDPDGILRYEWANARGCIARFDRDAIEIRVLDIQECPAADLAIAALVVDALKTLCEGVPLSIEQQNAFSTATLAEQFRRCLRDADHSPLLDDGYARALGVAPGSSAGDAWRQLFANSRLTGGEFEAALRHLLERGCLARRIARAVSDSPSSTQIEQVYRALNRCLLEGELFDERTL
jgi:hypothetical protein